MLSNKKIERVQCLLAAGLSNREAATVAKVSRYSVEEIAAGRLKPQPPKEDEYDDADYNDAPSVMDDTSLYRNEVAEYCPGCTYMVFKPCRICRARRRRERKNRHA